MGFSDNKRYVYLFILVAISLVATIICGIHGQSLPDSFKRLIILPLGNTFFTLVFVGVLVRGNMYYDFPILIITSLFTMRNAVTPLVMSVTTCMSRFGVYPNSRMVNIGIAVFLYETIAVYTYLAFAGNKPFNKRIRLVTRWRVPKETFTIILAGGLFLSVMSFVLLPELRTQYYSVFTNDITHLFKETATYGSGVKRALSTSSNMIIEATRLTLSSYIIFRIRRTGDDLFAYFRCIFVILVQFLFINDSNAYVLMIAFSLYMLVYKLFPRYGRMTLQYLAIIIIAFLALMYINRFSKDIYGTSLSIFLQAYFPGLNNFATIEALLDRNIFDVIKQIFIDLYAAVPFRSTLFGYQGGLDALPTLWHKSIGLYGQIMPNIAQSYYYFGPILCPILSIVLCSIGIKTFRKAEETKNPCLYTALIYLSLYSCVSITMYDFYIFMTMLLTRYLFMYIFSYFCKEQMVFKDSTEKSVLT